MEAENKSTLCPTQRAPSAPQGIGGLLNDISQAEAAPSCCTKDAGEASQTEGPEFSIHLRPDTVGAVPRLPICSGVHENVFNFF